MSYASYDMLTHGVNLTNSSDVVANSYSVIRGDSIVNILDIIPGGAQGTGTVDAYTKTETDIKLLNKADKNSTYTEVEVDTMLLATVALIDNKASTTYVHNYVDSSNSTVNDKFLSYETVAGNNVKLNDKADKSDTYPKAEINTAILTINASLDNKCSTYAVDIQSKFKIKAISDNVLKIQKIVGSNVYDALSLEFNPENNTSTLKVNNVNILDSVNNVFCCFFFVFFSLSLWLQSQREECIEAPIHLPKLNSGRFKIF